MSTSTTPPQSFLQSIEPHWVHNYAVFIKAHEKLFISLAIIIVAFFAYNKAVTAWDQHEQRLDTIAQQKVTADAAANMQLTSQLAALQTQYAASQKVLQAKIAQLQLDLSTRQTQNNALPLPELGQRWSTLLTLPTGAITATADDKLQLTSGAAHATVNELEKVPVLTAQLNLANTNLDGCKQVSAQQDKVIAGLNTQLTDTNAARIADQKLAKAKQRKSWLSGFKWGFISGFVGGVFVGHKI